MPCYSASSGKALQPQKERKRSKNRFHNLTAELIQQNEECILFPILYNKTKPHNKRRSITVIWYCISLVLQCLVLWKRQRSFLFLKTCQLCWNHTSNTEVPTQYIHTHTHTQQNKKQTRTIRSNEPTVKNMCEDKPELGFLSVQKLTNGANGWWARILVSTKTDQWS